jgi:hypothetical protein
MSDKSSENSEKRRAMTSLQYDDPHSAVRSWLEDIAGQRRPAESISAMLRRIAIAAGIPAVRVRALWYGEARRIDWKEGEAIRLKAEQVSEYRRRRIDDNEKHIQRTREHVAEIADRIRLSRGAAVDVETAHSGSKFLFWLGRENPDLG